MFEIIGYESLKFSDRDTGEVVSGIMFYLKGEEIEKNGSGNVVISKFFPDNRIIGVANVGSIAEFNVTINSKAEPKITGIKIS